MIGELLAGRYRIERLLGKGGMGAVYAASHAVTGRRVAVKVIHAGDLPEGDARLGRFKREARAAGALVSDHIAHVLDADEDPATGAPFMVMELLEGEDLQQLLKRVGPLRPDAALRVTAQACLGLSTAHEAGVIHRDIKPANLFLNRRDDGTVVLKLVDFGIAKIRVDDTVDPQTALTNTGNVLGSPHYLSPEQARASKDVDPRTDVWSLGVTLYRALTGRTPHEKLDSFINLMMAICLQPAPPVQSFAPWVSDEIAAVVHRALEIDRDARFPSAAAMLDALRPLLPDGWALSAPLLVGLDDRDRVPASPSQRPPSLAPGASTATTPASGSTPTPSVTSTAGPGSRPQRSPAPQTAAIAAPRGRRGLVAGVVGLASLAAAGFLVVTRAGGGRPPGAVAQTAGAETTAAPAPSPSPTAAPAPTSAGANRRVKLVIEPSDAIAEVDGAPAASDRGVVTLEGPMGSTHRVRVRKGRSTIEEDVAITESGALPPKLELVATAAPGPRPPLRTGEAAAPSPTATPAPSAGNKLRTSFE